MKLRRKLATVAATLTMGTALAMAPASPAAAASNCWAYTGGGRGLEWVCRTIRSAPIYSTPGGPVIGYIPPSWIETAMYCRDDGGPWHGVWPHPARWVFSYEAGGWLNDAHIYNETDSIGRICPAAI